MSSENEQQLLKQCCFQFEKLCFWGFFLQWLYRGSTSINLFSGFIFFLPGAFLIFQDWVKFWISKYAAVSSSKQVNFFSVS
jgi:hypothetical protein